MGKGKRARLARAGQKEQMKIAAQKLRVRKKITKIISVCAGAIAAAAIVGIIVYSTIAGTGYFLRNTVAMSSKNFKIDNAMMTYYLKNEYYSFVNTYSDYLSMYGLDTTKSLKSQKYGDETWFDYFLTQAKTQAEDILLCAEKAKEAGKEVSEHDLEHIDESIESMKSHAKQNKITFSNYLSQTFAKGVNEKDIRKAMELSYLASDYNKEYVDSLSYNDEQLQKYFDENKSEFIKVDYLSYALTSDDEDKTIAKQQSKDFAEKLAACKTADEFKSTLKTLLTDHYTKINTTEDAKAAKTEIETSVEDDLSTIEGTNYYPTEKAEEQDALTKWMFADATTENSTFIVEPTDDDTTYTAYIIVKPMYFDDYATADIRHILVSADMTDDEKKAEAKKEAEHIVEEFNAGDKSVKSFIEIAKEHSDDANVEENEGLYEGVTKDTANYPQTFIDWSYDASRKTGDIGIIETDSGYHVMYFEKVGKIAWKAAAENGKKSDDWNAHLEQALKEFPVEANDSKMNSIKA